MWNVQNAKLIIPGGELLLHVLYESVPYNKQITPLVSCFYVQAKGNLVIDNDVSREKRIIYIVPCNTDSLPKMFHRLCFLLLKAKSHREKNSFYSKSSQHKPKWSLILLSRVLEKKKSIFRDRRILFLWGLQFVRVCCLLRWWVHAIQKVLNVSIGAVW